jgi:hypothetical protein
VESIVNQFMVKSLADDKAYQVRIFEPYRIVEEINRAFPEKSTRYAVNLGCGDGKSMNDPAYPLFTKGYAGLAVEGEQNSALFENLPAQNIHKLTGTFVTPYNVREILEIHRCPQDCDFFKIDLDGYDGVILGNVLESGFRPKVLQAEVNPEFPPPVSFCVLYDEHYRQSDPQGNVGGFYGASLAYVADLCGRYGYRIAQIDFVTQWTHDVTLVREEFLPVLEQHAGRDFLQLSARDLFLSHPPGWPHFREYGIDTLPWRYETDYYRLIGEVWSACLLADQRKHAGHCVPFHLSLT